MSCRNSLLLFPAQCAGKFGALWAGEHWELPSRVSRTVFVLFSRPVFFLCAGRKKEVEWMNKKQKLNQNRAPIYEALERFRKMRARPQAGPRQPGADGLSGPAVRGCGREQHEAAG